jgi:hypothetical protein
MDSVPSTILDLTGSIPRVLREGAIPVDRLRTVASIITDSTPYAGSEPVDSELGDSGPVGPEVASEKPAMPHPLNRPPGLMDSVPADSVSDEPPPAGKPVP